MITLIINSPCVSSEQRNEEYAEALCRNLENPHIDAVISLADKGAQIREHQKLVLKELDERPTFKTLFQYATEQLLPNTLCCIVNADIAFDESIAELEQFHNPHYFVCLSRWEKYEGEPLVRIPNPHRTQDAWVFVAPAHPVLLENTDFYLGKPGCDNLIASWAHRAGLRLFNPCHTVKATHVHRVKFKTYSPHRDRLGCEQHYVKVSPSDLKSGEKTWGYGKGCDLEELQKVSTHE